MLKFIFKTVPKAIERGIKKCFFSTLALIIKKRKYLLLMRAIKRF